MSYTEETFLFPSYLDRMIVNALKKPMVKDKHTVFNVSRSSELGWDKLSWSVRLGIILQDADYWRQIHSSLISWIMLTLCIVYV